MFFDRVKGRQAPDRASRHTPAAEPRFSGPLVRFIELPARNAALCLAAKAATGYRAILKSDQSRSGRIIPSAPGPHMTFNLSWVTRAKSAADPLAGVLRLSLSRTELGLTIRAFDQHIR